MKNNSDLTILIIDNNEDFSLHLSAKLKQYTFKTLLAFDEDEVFALLKKYPHIDIILLNIDQAEDIHNQLFEKIQKNFTAKIILLSSEDRLTKREFYFEKGVLDYHLTSQKIDHIVDDIFDTIISLKNNCKAHVLLIDNDLEKLHILEKILSIRNYNVLCAATAKEGLNLLQEYDITLLILDMEVRDINSQDLLEGLKDLYLLNNFFVLALSDSFHPSTVRDALKSGARDILKKPFLYEEFILKTDLLINSSMIRKTTSLQKKEIENNLKKFKELLNSTIEAMFIFEENICINCNYEAIQLLGYSSKNDILEKNLSDIFVTVSNFHIEELLKNHKDYTFADTIINQNEKVYQVEIKARNICIDNNQLKIIAILDVTDVKKHEKMLSQQTKMASMGEMIGHIAHQWRQPLTAISIAAGGIKLDYELEIENREETIIELDNIVENTKFLSETIESFQNFLKSDKVTIQFDLKSTFQKTLAIINPNLKSNKITIIENYYDNGIIEGIQNELVQVLLNIINNAADIINNVYENGNEKYIVLTLLKKENEMHLMIHDNGGGIPQHFIQKIFEPYFTTKHQMQGTGLGLYMSHKIIEKMTGRIEVENRSFTHQGIEHFGALFTIILPR